MCDTNNLVAKYRIFREYLVECKLVSRYKPVEKWLQPSSPISLISFSKMHQLHLTLTRDWGSPPLPVACGLPVLLFTSSAPRAWRIHIARRLENGNTWHRCLLSSPPVSFKLRDSTLNKIEIRPIDAPLEVLRFTTFSIYFFFQFEWHSYMSDTLIWVTFQFVWHKFFSEILIWVTSQF